MDNAGSVRGPDRRGHLLDQRHRFSGGQGAPRSEMPRERVTLQQLHGEERNQARQRPSDAIPIEDAAHIGVSDVARERDFSLQALDRALFGRHDWRERLQRDALAVEDEILGLIHLAHSALAAQPHDPETA